MTGVHWTMKGGLSLAGTVMFCRIGLRPLNSKSPSASVLMVLERPPMIGLAFSFTSLRGLLLLSVTLPRTLVWVASWRMRVMSLVLV